MRNDKIIIEIFSRLFMYVDNMNEIEEELRRVQNVLCKNQVDYDINKYQVKQVVLWERNQGKEK